MHYPDVHVKFFSKVAPGNSICVTWEFVPSWITGCLVHFKKKKKTYRYLKYIHIAKFLKLWPALKWIHAAFKIDNTFTQIVVSTLMLFPQYSGALSTWINTLFFFTYNIFFLAGTQKESPPCCFIVCLINLNTLDKNTFYSLDVYV